MRILSPIVQIPAGPVLYLRHDRSLSNAVAAQAVRDEASWLIPKPTQQMLEEPLGGGAISPLLHQNIQDDTMLIDCAPQVVLHAPDADEHFVEVPGVPRPRPPSLQSSGEFGTELQAPEPDAFVGDQDPAFGENQLDITQAQAEHMIQPYCVTDDLRWKPMPGVDTEPC